MLNSTSRYMGLCRVIFILLLGLLLVLLPRMSVAVSVVDSSTSDVVAEDRIDADSRDETENADSETGKPLEEKFLKETPFKEEPASPLEAGLEDTPRIVQQFYAQHDMRPVWTEMSRVEALVEALESLGRDGLNPDDYKPGQLAESGREALSRGADSEARVDFEIKASRTLFMAMSHLQRGKVDPRRIEGGWKAEIAPPSFDMAAVSQALDAGDVAGVMDMAQPNFEPYRQLRSGLEHYRNIQRAGGWPQFPERSSSLRPGDRSSDVMLLRERLAIFGELELLVADEGYYSDVALSAQRQANVYDAALVDAVRRFQRQHLLDDDGIVGPATRRELNMTVGQRIDQIRVNMERARWLLHGLPDSFVLVDIAGYRISYFRPDGEVWRSRIVVGQPYRKTPALRSEITHLTLHPTWTVPPTIYREDILPQVRRNPGYLASRDMVALTPSGRVLNPWWVNWSYPDGIILRQAAGPRNPLGRLVIRFPNDYSVYLHDTPNKELFDRPQRALSSGCIRVEGIEQLVQMLFEDSGTKGDIDRLLADDRTRNVSLAQDIPLILNYWTAQPGKNGDLSFRPDIYQRDGAVLAALDAPVTL
ncbi:L,D-transpeptidase family protein [Halomonas binhaiensis]|nr:L,D-transpeptidase family protein [Halomonas binhaiensis]